MFPQAQIPDPQRYRRSKQSVLIVEDEESLLEMLAFRFKKAGYSVHTATDGVRACEKIGKRRPDIILMDIMLPGLNGLEILEMLRNHPESTISKIPVIMATAQTTPETLEKSLQLGADSFYYKPYSIADLILCAGALLNKYRRNSLAPA